MSSRQARILAITPALFALGFISAPAVGDTLGWWRMEGEAGTLVGDVPNAVDGVDALPDAALRGTPLSTYGTDVANTHIYDPITDATYANTSSFTMSENNTLRVDNHASMDQTSFTIEFFIKSEGGLVNYRQLVMRGSGQPDSGWWVGTRPKGDGGQLPSAKIANTDLYDADNDATVIDDGEWHHIALVVDNSGQGEDSGSMALYVDYEQVRTRPLDPGDHLYSVSMQIADTRLSGSIDEVRFSSGVLTADQFLQAVVPEPATMGLLLMGGLVALRRRR